MTERSEAVEEQAVRDGSAVYSVEAEIATAEDLPPGYKRTEVGVIPADWDVVAIGELARTYSGGTPSTARPEYYGGDIPWITSSDLNRRTIRNVEGRITKKGIEKSSAKMVETGTLIIALYGATAGVSAITNIRAAINQAVLAVVTRSYDTKLLLNMLSFNKDEYVEKLTQGGQPNLSGALVRSIKVPVPPIEEQRAIATALSDADALIESLDRLIAKKRAIKQAAMQQLLTGQTRLPGFTGEWETKRLGELGTTYGGLVGKTKKDFGVGTGRYITFLNIVSNTVIDCSAFEAVSVWPLETQNKVAKGDFFFNGSSETPEEVGMCAVLTEEVGSVFLNSFCFGFRLQDNALSNPLYLAYYFRSQEGREILKVLAQGATRYNLSKTALMDVVFPVPELDEQTAVATVLSDMDTEIEALERRRAKARQIKQGMMQQLLTGRVRLVTPEVAA